MTSNNDVDEEGTKLVSRIASLDFVSLLRSRPSSPALSADSGRSEGTSLIHSIEAQLKRGSPVNYSTLVCANTSLMHHFHLTALLGSCVGCVEKSEWCWSR
jgi:hypothetical protein